MEINKLLKEQIAKFLSGGMAQQEQVKHFIDAVNNSYNEYEQKVAATNAVNKVKKAKRNNEENIHPGEGTQIQAKDNVRHAAFQWSASDHRLSQLIANLQNGILLEDENRNILLTNQLFCDMFGIPLQPEAMKGMSCMDSAEQSKHLFKQPGHLIDRIETLLKNKQVVTGDELEMADGRVLLRDYVPIFVDSQYTGHLWKYLDITAEKEKKNELRRLALVASANENGVAFCDAAGVISWANEGLTRLTGYTTQEIIGTKGVALCKGPLSNGATIKKILNAFYAGAGFNVEVVFYRKNQSWFWGRIKGQGILDDQGKVQPYFAMIEDITLEKQKAEQLKVLSLIAEDNTNAVIILDVQGAITWVNKSFVKITGYTLQEVKGKRPGMMQGPDTNPETVAYLQEQISSGRSFDCELLNYTKSGAKSWMRVQGQPIINSKGKLSGFFALEQDITQEREDRQKLKEYESRYRKAFEKIGDNVWEHDFSTGKIYFSNTESHLLGYTFSDFTDNADLWWNRTHDDDRLILEQNDARYRAGEIDHHVLEYRIIHKDGSVRWVMDRGVVIELNSENKPLKIIGTHTDITERKQAEELLKREEQKYRSIIANMNLGLLEVDTEEKVIFTNQSFCEMSGYDYEELIGKRASHIYVKEENIELIESKNEARKRGSLDAYEIAVKNKRGQLRWWLISGAPRYNDAGDLVGSIGIHLDITDQKQLETDLTEARELAESSTRSKEVFLANMSHEIRTPMNAILGMTYQLTKTNLDSKQLFYLDTINSASENLLVIINDILDISKIEAGKLNLESIGFEPQIVLGHAIKVMMHRAEEKGLSITISNCDLVLSPVLLGDPYRLNQVLLNLISNAIKFTEKGGVDVSFTVLKDEPARQTVLVQVKDTGIGMEELFVRNLFEKFSQEDVSVTRQYGGTGLGMSICKDLVELMEGEIKVESKKGIGTTVSLTVNFAKGSAADLPSKPVFSINKDMLANKKILVVDDNNMNRLVAKTILHDYGALTVEAVNGQEAVELLQQYPVDLVLMDIQMPVMGGIEATTIIRRDISQSLPVIALTANAIKGDNEKYISAGMNAYLSKPFTEADLLQIVSAWLEDGNAAPGLADMVTVPNKSYDLGAIRAISRGNEIFVIKMVNMFIEQTPVQVVEMETHYHQGDYKSMAAVAHKIKPVIDNMGIASLKAPIREIEKMGKAGTADDSLPHLLQTVSKNIAVVIEGLQKEFG